MNEVEAPQAAWLTHLCTEVCKSLGNTPCVLPALFVGTGVWSQPYWGRLGPLPREELGTEVASSDAGLLRPGVVIWHPLMGNSA